MDRQVFAAPERLDGFVASVPHYRMKDGPQKELCPFSKNLTQLMFDVASNLSDAQREKETQFFSLQECHCLH